GLIPAVISPYVAAAIGPRACRRYFLTAEKFAAASAAKLALVDRVVEPETLEAARDETIKQLLNGGPAAQVAAKDLIRRVTGALIDGALRRGTATRLARA